MKKLQQFDLFDELILPKKTIKKLSKVTEQGLLAKRFIIEYFIPRYTELFQIPPKISWGKDLKLIITIIKTYKDISIFGFDNHFDFLVKLCEKYFTSKNSLTLKSVWSIGVFYTNIDNIVLSLKNSNEEIVEPIMEGYKLAFWNHTGNKFEGSLIGKEEIFSHIYLILKPFWLEHGKEFSLKRFSELFFLVILGYTKDMSFDLHFFTSKFTQERFQQWLETEGKEELMFFPKDIGKIDKNKIELEQTLMLEEEKKLYYNIK